MVKKTLIFIAIAIVSYLIYSGVAQKREYERGLEAFINPSHESVAAELRHNLSVEISDESEIILAHRTKPHPFFGEYSGCLIISVGNDDRQKFLDAFERADSNKSTMPCPNHDEFYVRLKDRRLDFIGRINPESDESYQLWVVGDNKALFLMTSIS